MKKSKGKALKGNAKIIRELLDGETYFHQQLIEVRKVRDGWKRKYEQASILCRASFRAGVEWRAKATNLESMVKRAIEGKTLAEIYYITCGAEKIKESK